MIENRNVNIITDADGKKLVEINDMRFKANTAQAIPEFIKIAVNPKYEANRKSDKA